MESRKLVRSKRMRCIKEEAEVVFPKSCHECGRKFRSKRTLTAAEALAVHSLLDMTRPEGLESGAAPREDGAKPDS